MFISRPMMNSRRMRPISEITSMLAWSVMSLKPILGPMIAPAMR
jgi:hypothetical protein